MKLILATPFYEQKAWADFTICLVNCCAKVLQPAGIEWDFIHLSGDSYVDRARNTIAARFMEGDGTHLMFIDSDMGWSIDAFARVVAAKKDMIGATYPVKNKWENYPVAVNCNEGGFPLVEAETGFISVEMLPAGFLKISRTVFEKIAEREPGNTYIDPSDGGPETVRQNYFGVIHEGGKIYREDTAFCLRARRAGVPIWLEPRASMRHWGVKAWEGNYHEFLLAQPGGSNHVLDEAPATR